MKNPKLLKLMLSVYKLICLCGRHDGGLYRKILEDKITEIFFCTGQVEHT